MIFDASARHGSFTKAAEELNIQQPSVSAAIRQLEEALGVKLFLRAHRKVELTEAGSRLFSDVSKALADIDHSIQTILQMGQGDHITINSSSAFSYYWLMPRLTNFHKAHPGIDLRMQISDREPDLAKEEINLGVRLGDGNWPDVHAVKIAEEIIFPVAHPEVFKAASNMSAVGDLLKERLIHLEEPIRKRPTWAQWFEHHNVQTGNLTSGLRLNDYALVLQAAMSGEGFAFGWEHVVRELVKRGLLSAREDWGWETGRGIFLIWSRNNSLSKQSRLETGS